MKTNLRISNMIVTGFIGKKVNIQNLIKNSKWLWEINNEDMSPIYATRIIKDKKILNVQHKPKSIYVSLWSSGAVNIVGVTKFKDAKEVYKKLLKELRKTKSI